MAYTNALANFDPVILAKELALIRNEEFVFQNCVSYKWKGEISGRGSVVDIPTVDVPDPIDYDPGVALTYADLTDTKASLSITEEKVWRYKVDDLDKHFAGPLGAAANTEAMRQEMKKMMRLKEAFAFGATTIGQYGGSGTANRANTKINATGAVHAIIDGTTAPADWATSQTFVAGDRRKPTSGNINGYVYECTTGGAGSTTTEPVWPTTIGATVVDNAATWTCAGYLGVAKTAAKVAKGNVYSYFTSAKRLLSETKAWKPGEMIAVVNPAIIEMIETSTELSHATQKGDDVIAKGFYGTLAGFNLYESLNCTGSGTDAAPFNLFFGRNDVICFADTFSKGPEVLRLESSMADAVRGMEAYGATVPAVYSLYGVRWEVEV